MSSLDKVVSFLESAGTYFLATAEGDQPRVRPFGTVLLYENRIYIQTGKVKEVSKQIAANPKVEISAFNNGSWIRISGELADDPRREVKVAMLEKYPDLKGMYSADDDNTQVLYFKSGKASFCSFTAAPEVVEL